MLTDTDEAAFLVNDEKMRAVSIRISGNPGFQKRNRGDAGAK
jgi:hypothetical protein